jgi:CheY-like chemotaxis protein
MGRILVIDDEPSVREALLWALKAGAHEVTLAADGLEGVRKYKAEAPDLVITDLFMPVQDGVKTIIELRTLDPQVRILAISGNALSETVLPIAQRLGAIAVLQKPWEIKQLLQVVNTLLDRKTSSVSSEEVAKP